MQMVKNSLMGIVLVWFVLLLFMPKQELYYKLEEQLKQNDIIINESKIDSGIFGLSLEGLDVYVKGIKLAKIDKINLFTLLFYTHIEIEGIHMDDSLKSMAPTEIETATFAHALWNPLVVSILSEGQFGRIEGGANINAGTLRLDFNDTSTLGSLKPQLNQDEKGWYYETSF